GIATAGESVGFLGISAPAVAPDGSVLLKGWSTSPVATLLRFTADGALDATFGTDGIATLSGIGPSTAQYAAIQPDGKYLISGDTELQGGDIHILLARVMHDGSLDPGFGITGSGFTSFDVMSGGGFKTGWTVGLDADGRILMVGNDYGASPTLSFVARFENDITVTIEPTAQPLGLTLSAPAPNPTSGSTSLAYTLTQATPIRASVFDLLGREIAVLAEGDRTAGQHEVIIEATRLPPGLYVVRFTAGSASLTRRLSVVH
ncbi:MAG: T9SS type A sorting domain-containing protein, partial [Rubricoccaceae bacterium]|nr:T9SS type A sorting domain-containing protein [Rubricoccaceae bacterium]